MDGMNDSIILHSCFIDSLWDAVAFRVLPAMYHIQYLYCESYIV